MSAYVSEAGHLGNKIAGAGEILRFLIYTEDTGVAYDLAGTPVISVYKDDNTTQNTSSVTLTTNYDGVTGLSLVEIDLSDSFYDDEMDCYAVITTGTVNGKSVVGVRIASWRVDGLFAFSVVADASNSETSFKTDLPSPVDDFYAGIWIKSRSGALKGQTKRIYTFDGTTKFVTLSGGFTSTPVALTTFKLINE